MSALGGKGGAAGLPGTGPYPGGPRGDGAPGGNGGAAPATAQAQGANGAAHAGAVSIGGRGGDAYGSGDAGGSRGGNGGNATSGVAVHGSSATLTLSAVSTGGNGGMINGNLSGSGSAGNGGRAAAAARIDGATAAAALGGDVTATGGNGGTYTGPLPDPNAPVPVIDMNGGNGGDALASSVYTRGAAIARLTQSAFGGQGGNAYGGTGGAGGNASALLTYAAASGPSVFDAGIAAVGGTGGSAVPDPRDSGSGGSGGNASAILDLRFAVADDGGLDAVMHANGTATAGNGGSGALFFFGPSGNALAQTSLTGYGTVHASATANGALGGNIDSVGTGRAVAIAASNLSATADAVASGGSSTIDPGNGGDASASARSNYLAGARAQATSGSGRFGNSAPSNAVADAAVVRSAGGPLALRTGGEARAEALGSSSVTFNQISARSSFVDERSASGAVASVSTLASGGGYGADGQSAANVGGTAYGAWTPAFPLLAVSYASTRPDAATLGPLLAQAPRVAAAFAGADVLGEGTQGAMFFSYAMRGEFRTAVDPQRHLLIGFFAPVVVFGDAFSEVDLSISNFGKVLFSHAFTSASEATQFFDDRALDLGISGLSTLDLVVTTQMPNGGFGFSYAIGAGDAVAPVPEAGTWLLLSAGLALTLFLARRRRSP